MSVPACGLDDVSKAFPGRDGKPVIALDRVSMHVGYGEVVAVIGESGAGKSSLARIVLGLLAPDHGRVEILGQDPAALSGAARRDLRRRVTAVFQEPYDSLDPRMTVRQIIEDPLVVHYPGLKRGERLDVCLAAMRNVALEPLLATRYPHELSGGQQQRVSLARAFVTLPELVVLDEPTSALDASTRGQVIDVLRGLQAQRGVSLLLVTHDIGTVRRLAGRIVVLYRGRVVESGPAAAVLTEPQHPYTRLLLSAELTIDTPPVAALPQAPAQTADPADGPSAEAACVFRARCPLGDQACDVQRVELRPAGATAEVGAGHQAACVKTPITHPDPHVHD
jgi:oligopeptide/dipeptide ABC transporter ATP-binding protein